MNYLVTAKYIKQALDENDIQAARQWADMLIDGLTDNRPVVYLTKDDLERVIGKRKTKNVSPSQFGRIARFTADFISGDDYDNAIRDAYEKSLTTLIVTIKE